MHTYSLCRCESGDLSGKHGKLIFSPLGPNRRIEAYVDPNLQLLGEYKSTVTSDNRYYSFIASYSCVHHCQHCQYLILAVIGRSIGLHMSPPNTVLFSCAEVKQVEMNSQKYDVMVAFPEPANFERCEMLQYINASRECKTLGVSQKSKPISQSMHVQMCPRIVHLLEGVSIASMELATKILRV